jgi:hypothetical protein
LLGFHLAFLRVQELQSLQLLMQTLIEPSYSVYPHLGLWNPLSHSRRMLAFLQVGRDLRLQMSALHNLLQSKLQGCDRFVGILRALGDDSKAGA